MNIFFRELKAQRKALIIWSISVMLLIISGAVKYAAYQSTGQSINQLLATLPQIVQVIFGVNGFDVSNVLGYYGFFFIYIAILAAIHATSLGVGIIAKEERDHTSEFLFVKPVTRTNIITAKLLAALTNIIILNIIIAITSIWIFNYYAKGISINHYVLLLMMSLFFLQLIFLFLGACLAAICKKAKTASSLSMGILLLTYVISIFAGINQNLNILKYITPFKYFDAKLLLDHHSLDPMFMILSFIIITILIVCTHYFYNKRDLSI